MFYDIYGLENSLNNGEFEFVGSPQLDTYKLLEALKFLTAKVRDMESQQLAMQTDLINSQSETHKLQEELETHKTIIRKIGKDYPEIVIAKPHFFGDGLTNNS